MDFFISAAMAQNGAGEQNILVSFIPLILIVVIFWFLLIRPQMKRNKQHREMVASLNVGDEIVTAGGLLGKVTEIGDNFLTVELSDRLTVKLQRTSVAQVVPKGTADSAN